LIDRLRKISQYVRACEELLRAARRYRVFSNIDFEFVDLQQGGRRLSIDAVCDADKIIEASCTRETLSRISSHQHLSELDTRKRIKARLGENSRLHAEIQLVLHFEQHPTLFRPRVICSSKSACYLCHLLLKIHNQYFIPSSHGKLYDTWKWPTPTQLSHTSSCHRADLSLQCLLPEFSNAIDHKIRDSLDHARAVRRIEPLESRVDLLAAMTPSILSRISQSLCNAAIHQQNVDIASADTDGIDDKSSIMSTYTVRGLGVDIPTTSPVLHVEDSMSCNEIATPTTKRHPSRGSPMYSVRDGSVLDMNLRSGETTSHSFTVGKGLLHVHVPGLQVGLQYGVPPAEGSLLVERPPQTQGKSFQMEIQYLSSSMACSDVGLAQAVDLEEGDWVEMSTPEGVLFSAEGLVLKRRSTLLRLRAQSACDSGQLPQAAPSGCVSRSSVEEDAMSSSTDDRRADCSNRSEWAMNHTLVASLTINDMRTGKGVRSSPAPAAPPYTQQSLAEP
jgi:OTT_1508-like deaminase